MVTTPDQIAFDADQPDRIEDTRSRSRQKSIKLDEQEIVNRVIDFYTMDKIARDEDREIRLQRYAKYRMWVEGKNFPWEEASDVPLSDMMEKSLRVQDTIHNAVMSARPPIGANAINIKDRDTERIIDALIDYQVFEENEGEKIIGDMAEAFLNDGVVTVFIPWIKDRRDVSDLLLFPPIPEELDRRSYFEQILSLHFSIDRFNIRMKANGWDGTLTLPENEDRRNGKIEFSFYTKSNGDVELVTRREAEIFNGPRPIVVDYDDILHDTRAENLQIKSPSNPGGSSHVILIDYPTVDEIKRLQKSGFYDLVDEEDLEELEAMAPAFDIHNEEETQRDVIAGMHSQLERKSHARSHHPHTRLVCFDSFDVDGDGIDEDVIFWVLLESKQLLKAVFLTEMYPGLPPKRPFAESPLLPVRGRRVGISFLEMLEGLHDAIKTILDQSIDAGTLSNTPFGFYSQRSGLRPEIINLQPNEMYPVPDASRDINFPNIGNPSAQAFAINMVTLLSQMEERVSMIGDVQFGRVPPGRSSALRTATGLALLSGQGEARPERIMRRFFICLSQMWERIHSLNQHFLPDNKKFRIIGVLQPGQDPYQEVSKRDNIAGNFDFSFKANVLNTSKQSLQESINLLMGTYIAPLTLQMGIINPDGIYRLLKDFGKAFGHNPDDYLTPPSPESMQTRLLAEEALQSILNSRMPQGIPAEVGGAREHMQKLITFMQSDDFGILTPNQTLVFNDYLQVVRQQLDQQIQQEQLVQAAQQFAQQGGLAGVPGRPPEQAGVNTANPLVSGPGELLNETLPTAGGGGGEGRS